MISLVSARLQVLPEQLLGALVQRGAPAPRPAATCCRAVRSSVGRRLGQSAADAGLGRRSSRACSSADRRPSSACVLDGPSASCAYSEIVVVKTLFGGTGVGLRLLPCPVRARLGEGLGALARRRAREERHASAEAARSREGRATALSYEDALALPARALAALGQRGGVGGCSVRGARTRGRRRRPRRACRCVRAGCPSPRCSEGRAAAGAAMPVAEEGHRRAPLALLGQRPPPAGRA